MSVEREAIVNSPGVSPSSYINYALGIFESKIHLPLLSPQSVLYHS
jgi:hypothetical protein